MAVKSCRIGAEGDHNFGTGTVTLQDRVSDFTSRARHCPSDAPANASPAAPYRVEASAPAIFNVRFNATLLKSAANTWETQASVITAWFEYTRLTSRKIPPSGDHATGSA